MLNLNKIRDLNSFTLIYTQKGSPAKSIVSGFVNVGENPVKLSCAFPDGNLFGNGNLFGDVQTRAMFDASARILFGKKDTMPSIDFRHKHMYMGSEPVNFSFLVYIVPDEDKGWSNLKQKLNTIMEYLMPYRGDFISVEKAIGNFQIAYDDNQDTTRESTQGVTAQSLLDTGARNSLSAISTYIGDTIWRMCPPKTMQENGSISIKIGPILIPDLILSKLEISFPPVSYVDEAGSPVYDYFMLSIGVTSLYNASVDYFKQILSL